MNSNEARAIVQSGLNRRREESREAAREARLERYEDDMIRHCNSRCADGKILREAEEAVTISRKQMEERRFSRKMELYKRMAREAAVMGGVRKYVMFCIGMILLERYTQLPIWAAITLILGLALFLVVYIYRAFVPLED